MIWISSSCLLSLLNPGYEGNLPAAWGEMDRVWTDPAVPEIVRTDERNIFLCLVSLWISEQVPLWISPLLLKTTVSLTRRYFCGFFSEWISFLWCFCQIAAKLRALELSSCREDAQAAQLSITQLRLSFPHTGTCLVLQNRLFTCTLLGNVRECTSKALRKMQVTWLPHPHFDHLQGSQCSTQAPWDYPRYLPLSWKWSLDHLLNSCPFYPLSTFMWKVSFTTYHLIICQTEAENITLEQWGQSHEYCSHAPGQTSSPGNNFWHHKTEEIRMVEPVRAEEAPDTLK